MFLLSKEIYDVLLKVLCSPQGWNRTVMAEVNGDSRMFDEASLIQFL